MGMTRQGLARGTIAIIVGAAVLSAACSNDERAAPPTSETAGATASSTSGTIADATTTPGPRKIEIVGSDYEFEGLPSEFAAGSEITFRNASHHEVHEIVMVRLPDSETRSAAALLALPQEDQAVFRNVPPSVVIIDGPGADSAPITVFGDAVISEPGRYIVLCGVPMGMAPDDYLEAASKSAGPVPLDGRPPHSAAGMFGEVRVR